MPSETTEHPDTAPVNGYEARWERHNSERQTRILTAATELVEERPAGADISIQDIADHAGLAKSVVYRQFGGREDLDRRVRSHALAELADVLDSAMNISTGTPSEILSRTITAVAVWITDRPRIHEFMATGPTDYDDGSLDAISSLKSRIARSAQTIIAGACASVGVPFAPFASLPFAVVTMVEGTLTRWSRSPEPKPTREEIVTDLTNFSWYMLAGVARSSGITIDPDSELSSLLARFSTPGEEH
ncbi:AcrR family transcriptional regulator [Rhodococcus sp. 27YEA15]|uniref:TetR/AcrR family transcriptional regulator n=1 Tax=Rhodococcus sp. 27YEA15 TaxID=3156259 RepID=UPI003C7C5E88